MDGKPEKLDLEIFNLVVKHTPLISIDLIVMNKHKKILLGLRKNNPAKGYWFVPGGRILKNETIRDAFQRITRSELGISLTMDRSIFTGVYEHIHKQVNFSNEKGYGTHYIVMAFKIEVPDTFDMLPNDQHSGYKWFILQDLMKEPRVHSFVKNYFNNTVPVKG